MCRKCGTDGGKCWSVTLIEWLMAIYQNKEIFYEHDPIEQELDALDEEIFGRDEVEDNG
jgi:hypothetical protein